MGRSQRTKIAISVDPGMLERVDRLVGARVYPNRSRAIEAAVEEKLQRLARSSLARECKKLDKVAERALAEQGLSEDLAAWPEY